MEQFEWTPGGIHLLKTVHDFIDKNGGRINLLRLIREEEVMARKMLWRSTHLSSVSHDRIRKRVCLQKGKMKRFFASPKMAGQYIDRSCRAIRSGATKGHRVNGWTVGYVKRKV